MSTNRLAELKTWYQTARRHWGLLAAPVVGLTVLAAVYAVLKQDRYEAAQALIVRDEGARQGRFDDATQRKTAQETVVEVSRNVTVVRGALRQLQPARRGQEDWPSRSEIEELQDAISVKAPQGKELGATEVIYLQVQAESPQRAIQLTGAVCDQLQRRLQEIRNDKAASVIAELENSLAAATAASDESTARLAALESELGTDLADLTVLQSGHGFSSLKDTQSQLERALREARAAHLANLEQQKHIEAAIADESRQASLPEQVLRSHETLRKLRDALVGAKLQTVNLQGSMSLSHPRVRAALSEEELVRANLQRELTAALAALRADEQLSAAPIRSLEQQLEGVTQRLARLASIRAGYDQLVAEVRQKTQIVQKTREELAEARANQTSARSASLVTRVDQPIADERPVGPGRATIVVVGFATGLLTSCGLLLLVSPLGIAGGPGGRRWSDYWGGRRASDRQFDRRGASSPETARPEAARPASPGPPSPGPASPGGRRASDQPVPASGVARAGESASPAPDALTPAAAAQAFRHERSDNARHEVASGARLGQPSSGAGAASRESGPKLNPSRTVTQPILERSLTRLAESHAP